MDKTQQSLPGLIRQVLGSLHAETVIKKQILQLAKSHLHEPAIITALLQVLPDLKDKQLRDEVMFFLSSLNTSRFPQPRILFDALLQFFRQEKERDTRVALLFRLQDSIHQDQQLVDFFIELSATPNLSEPEMVAIQDTLANLPLITEEMAVSALEKHRNSPGLLQSQALTLAEKCTRWGDKLFAAAQPYLDIKNDPDIRLRVMRRLADNKQMSDAQLISLATALSNTGTNGIRYELLELLKPSMRIPEIRLAVANAFAANPSVYDDGEFAAITDMLAPYMGRDEHLSHIMLESLKDLPVPQHRRKVLSLVTSRLKTEQILDPLLHLFFRERDESIREVLFNQVKALSVARHPQLVDVFTAELTEPGSPFRVTCAGLLANVAEIYPQVIPALEDVLRYDTDRELLRLCLDGYLRPGITHHFDVLLTVVRNELIDTLSRQKALDAIVKLDLDATQQLTLADALSGIKPNVLKYE